LVRDKDLLTLALGQPEQTGRMCGLSSSIGWKRLDLEAIKEQVTLEITEKVTIDVIAKLHAQGLILSSPSNTPGKISASALDAVLCDVKLDKIARIDFELTFQHP